MDNMIRRIDKKNELSILSASLHKYFQPCAIRLVAKHNFRQYFPNVCRPIRSYHVTKAVKHSIGSVNTVVRISSKAFRENLSASSSFPLRRDCLA